jgi:hypothetical protein
MDGNRTQSLVITLPEYERIFRVVYGVVKGVGLNPARACAHISACGAYILNKYYKVPGKIVAGAAFFAVTDGPKPAVAAIGDMRDGQPYSDQGCFHVWVQTPTHAFDFQMPILGETVAENWSGVAVPSRMFQRLLEEDCNGDYRRAGDFAFFPNPELIAHFNEVLFEGTLLTDMVSIIDAWFRKPPKPIKEAVQVMDSKEGAKWFRLAPVRVNGSWSAP